MICLEQFIPAYFKLEQHLRELIRSGALKPGDPVPPESQLCSEHGISRITVRQALSRLVFEGLIVRRRGTGTFVAEPRLQHTHVFPSFEEEMRARGAVTSHRLLSTRREPAEGRVAESLAVADGTIVLVVERQRLVDGRIVGLEVRYFPLRIGEAITQTELESQPLVLVMRRILGRTHDRLDLRVTAGVARGREAVRLGVRPGAPVLIRENTWYLEGEGPIQYGRSVFRGDRYQMALTFTPWPQGGPNAGPGR